MAKAFVSASFGDSVSTASRGCNHSLTFPTFAVYLPIHLATAAPLKNIVKTALKYYTVSHRKNCRAVDGNLPLSPRASDDSYCLHEGNTSTVTLNSRAGGIPSRNIVATAYCRSISERCINQLCWIWYTLVSDRDTSSLSNSNLISAIVFFLWITNHFGFLILISNLETVNCYNFIMIYLRSRFVIAKRAWNYAYYTHDSSE